MGSPLSSDALTLCDALFLRLSRRGGRFLGGRFCFGFKRLGSKIKKKNQRLGYFVKKKSVGILNAINKNRPKNRPPYMILPMGFFNSKSKNPFRV